MLSPITTGPRIVAFGLCLSFLTSLGSASPSTLRTDVLKIKNDIPRDVQLELVFNTLAYNYWPELDQITESMIVARDIITGHGAVFESSSQLASDPSDDSVSFAPSQLNSLQLITIRSLRIKDIMTARSTLCQALHILREFTTLHALNSEPELQQDYQNSLGVSTAAMIQYIGTIRDYISPSELRLLFGIGQDITLATESSSMLKEESSAKELHTRPRRQELLPYIFLNATIFPSGSPTSDVGPASPETSTPASEPSGSLTNVAESSTSNGNATGPSSVSLPVLESSEVIVSTLQAPTTLASFSALPSLSYSYQPPASSITIISSTESLSISNSNVGNLPSSTGTSFSNFSTTSSVGGSPSTFTLIVYTTTSLCPLTTSSVLVSGSTSYVVTRPISTIVLTSTVSIPCHRCTGGPSTEQSFASIAQSFPSATISDSLDLSSSSVSTGSNSITVLIVVSTTTVSFPSTIGATTVSGSIYPLISNTESTMLVTSTITKCHECTETHNPTQVQLSYSINTAQPSGASDITSTQVNTEVGPYTMTTVLPVTTGSTMISGSAVYLMTESTAIMTVTEILVASLGYYDTYTSGLASVVETSTSSISLSTPISFTSSSAVGSSLGANTRLVTSTLDKNSSIVKSVTSGISVSITNSSGETSPTSISNISEMTNLAFPPSVLASGSSSYAKSSGNSNSGSHASPPSSTSQYSDNRHFTSTSILIPNLGLSAMPTNTATGTSNSLATTHSGSSETLPSYVTGSIDSTLLLSTIIISNGGSSSSPGTVTSDVRVSDTSASTSLLPTVEHSGTPVLPNVSNGPVPGAASVSGLSIISTTLRNSEFFSAPVAPTPSAGLLSVASSGSFSVDSIITLSSGEVSIAVGSAIPTGLAPSLGRGSSISSSIIQTTSPVPVESGNQLSESSAITLVNVTPNTASGLAAPGPTLSSGSALSSSTTVTNSSPIGSNNPGVNLSVSVTDIGSPTSSGNGNTASLPNASYTGPLLTGGCRGLIVTSSLCLHLIAATFACICFL